MSSPLTHEEIESWTAHQIRSHLKKRKLGTHGKKNELVRCKANWVRQEYFNYVEHQVIENLLKKIALTTESCETYMCDLPIPMFGVFHKIVVYCEYINILYKSWPSYTRTEMKL